MGKISLQNCLSETLYSEVLFLLFLPFTLLPYQAIWGYLMVGHISLYFKETFISWWWEYLPCTFHDEKLVFKGGRAALFVSRMKTEIVLEGKYDPAVFICAQRDRSTRARFHSVNWRPLKSLWWFKLPWELHKIIQGVSQEEVCRSCLVNASARGYMLPSVLGSVMRIPLQLGPSGVRGCSAPALCQLGTEQEAEQPH